jgi:hypothetical protein
MMLAVLASAVAFTAMMPTGGHAAAAANAAKFAVIGVRRVSLRGAGDQRENDN